VGGQEVVSGHMPHTIPFVFQWLGMGLSWSDGRLGDNYIDYKFTVEALPLNEWNDRFARSGQQITLYDNVYQLKDVADFAGIYKGVTTSKSVRHKVLSCANMPKNFGISRPSGRLCAPSAQGRGAGYMGTGYR
jgi:hypothetical protein